MPVESQTDRIFTLNVTFKDPLQNRLFSIVKGPIEHFLAFPRLNRTYEQIMLMKDGRSFPEKVLEQLGISYDLPAPDRGRLELREGPVIIVANHPYGGIEGLILASLLSSIRTDVKFMANYLLNAVPEMRDLLIAVNPFKGRSSVRDNIKPLRECIQWVRNGGMLVLFPAGAVSHFDVRKGGVTDPDWSPGIARIIRKSGAPVIPVFIQGSNSALFHMAGLVHPLLRTAMLPNELFNKNRASIRMRVGEPVPCEKLLDFEQDAAMMEYLRLCTYLLALRRKRKPAARLKMIAWPGSNPAPRTVIEPRNASSLAGEINRLPPGRVLVENGDSVVAYATADEIPDLLLEIGRLRETSFRAVGEGTGRSVDLDRFDRSYLHLFIWNRAKQEVVGAYRLGKTDELINSRGLQGLYTSTLFRFKPEFIERLGPALEMGRSFIRPEYQKSYTPLLLLWKGIGRFVVEHPRYKTLFGPVSITDDYQPLSKQVIVDFLKANRYSTDIAPLAVPRNPLRPVPLRGWDMKAAVRLLKDDVDKVSDLVSSAEPDGKGIPVLLKQYLKLGGRIAGFNVDPAFGNALDGLVLVDLTRTEQRMLERYLGKEGTRRFLAHHGGPGRERYATCA